MHRKLFLVQTESLTRRMKLSIKFQFVFDATSSAILPSSFSWIIWMYICGANSRSLLSVTLEDISVIHSPNDDAKKNVKAELSLPCEVDISARGPLAPAGYRVLFVMIALPSSDATKYFFIPDVSDTVTFSI